MSEVLLVMPVLFKNRIAIHDNVDDKLLIPELRNAEKMYILPLLGTALYKKLRDDIEASGAPSGDYKYLHDTYIVDILCNYVMSELPLALNFQFFNKGVSTQTTEQTSQPTMSDLFAIGAKYKKRADALAGMAINYLRANAETKFPEYLNAGDEEDTIYPDRNSYSSSLWLGDDYEPCSKNSDYNT